MGRILQQLSSENREQYKNIEMNILKEIIKL